MSDRAIKNAVIRKVTLGFHDGLGSIPTAMVHLDYAGSGQGFGGYCLKGTAAYDFIYGVLNALECDGWEKLVGESCRADADWGKVYRIGHFLKDQWFDPAITFAKEPV